MADPENFEDDLFADLYNDDEPTAKPSAVPDQSAPAAPAAVEPVAVAQDSQYQPENNGGDTYMNNDEVDDDDDEVAFNLGNGTTHHAESPSSYSAPPPQAAPTKGPNSKEDG